MTSGQRSTGWFAAGALGGGLLVLAAWLYIFGADSLPWAPEPAAPSTARIAVAEAENVVAAAAPEAPPTAEEVIVASSCPPQAAVPASPAGQDGQFMLDAALEARPLPTASAFLTVAREAAQGGRVRDAEVALIAACRVAERQGGSYSAPVADVKAQLGEHYLRMAGKAEDEEQGRVLYQRATALLSETADAYAAALGKNASRTRFAEKRLALVRANDPREAARLAASGFRTTPSTEMGAAAESAEEAAARSNARQLISSDPELAQMDSDIGRLHAQASRVTDDPRGMQRRDAEAAAKRDACPDRACLLRWYAQRRSQLLNEF